MEHPEFPRRSRTGAGAFIGQAWAEFRKVRWPSRHTALVYTRVIIGFVVVVGLFVVGLDLLFSR